MLANCIIYSKEFQNSDTYRYCFDKATISVIQKYHQEHKTIHMKREKKKKRNVSNLKSNCSI